MAFAYLSENGFETGAVGHFDAQSPSTFTRAFFYHFSDLAGKPGLPAPWHGAYCFGVDLATNRTDTYVQETGSWDTASGSTIWFRWMQWIGGPTFTMADGDEFYTFALWSSTNTREVVAGLRYTGTGSIYRFGVGASCLTHSTSVLQQFSLNQWHAVEVGLTMGTSTTSSISFFLDGAASSTITGLTLTASITSGVIGVMFQPSGTTVGSVLFDDIIADDLQIYAPRERFPRSQIMTASGHAFVGHGVVESVQLLSGAGTDNVLQLYDTDTGNTNDVSAIKLELKNTANNQMVDCHNVPIEFYRGCYVSLAGTNPRALVQIGRAAGYWSDGKIKAYGANRASRPQNR